METTFVRLAGSCTQGMLRFLEKTSWADIRLAKLEHPSMKKMMSFCSERVPIYVQSSFMGL